MHDLACERTPKNTLGQSTLADCLEKELVSHLSIRQQNTIQNAVQEKASPQGFAGLGSQVLDLGSHW